MNYEDILNYNDLLNETFGTEDMDLIEEDYYDADVATEATVKGVTKKVYAMVMNVGRRIIEAITRWIRNRSINKLVAFLKNKVAKFKEADQKKVWGEISKALSKGGKGSKHGDVGAGDYSSGSVTYVIRLMASLRTSDGLVKLQALLRQIKSTPVDKFGKEITQFKTTTTSDVISNVKKTGATMYTNPGNILSAIGDGNTLCESYKAIMESFITQANNNISIDNMPELSKGQCDIIGKSLKTLMAVISQFTLKTIHFFQRKDDQWKMTGVQKAIIKILKESQKVTYDAIKATNIMLSEAKTDDYEEVEESADMSITDMLMDMSITSESLSYEVENMDDSNLDDFEF